MFKTQNVKCLPGIKQAPISHKATLNLLCLILPLFINASERVGVFSCSYGQMKPIMQIYYNLSIFWIFY